MSFHWDTGAVAVARLRAAKLRADSKDLPGSLPLCPPAPMDLRLQVQTRMHETGGGLPQWHAGVPAPLPIWGSRRLWLRLRLRPATADHPGALRWGGTAAGGAGCRLRAAGLSGLRQGRLCCPRPKGIRDTHPRAALHRALRSAPLADDVILSRRAATLQGTAFALSWS